MSPPTDERAPMALSPERIEKRLKKVFIAVFPTLDADHITEASTDTVPTWDSLATLTLFTTAEAEFSITLGLDKIQETKSFPAMQAMISNALA